MKQTLILPNDQFDNFDRMKESLSDLENVTMAHDVNELSDVLQPIKDDEKIVIIDFGWDRGYEFAIQDCAKDPMARREFLDKTPVICIHGNPAWLMSSVRKRMHDEIGVVGFISTKDTFTWVNQRSRLHDVIAELQNCEGAITSAVFDDVMRNLPKPKPKRLRTPVGP